MTNLHLIQETLYVFFVAHITSFLTYSFFGQSVFFSTNLVVVAVVTVTLLY